MAKQATELRYAVRFRVVCKHLGQLCIVLAALTLAPLVMSVIFGDTGISLRYGIVILTHSKNMPALQERWQPKPAQEEPKDANSTE